MPTIKQLIRNARQPIKNVTKSPALRGCPQRRGTCTRVYVRLVKFRSWVWRNEKKNSLRPLPMNRIDRVEDGYLIDSFRISKNEDISSTYYVYVMKFMVSIGVNPITPFEIRRNFPLVAKSYPLSGGNQFIRSKKVMLLFFKKRTNRVSYPANFQN